MVCAHVQLIIGVPKVPQSTSNIRGSKLNRGTVSKKCESTYNASKLQIPQQQHATTIKAMTNFQHGLWTYGLCGKDSGVFAVTSEI